MSSAIEKRDETIMRLRGQLRSVREVADEKAEDLMEFGVECAAAFLFGNAQADAEANNRALPTVANLDPEVVWSAGLMLGGQLLGGTAGAVVTNAGRGIAVSYAYERGRGRR